MAVECIPEAAVEDVLREQFEALLVRVARPDATIDDKSRYARIHGLLMRPFTESLQQMPERASRALMGRYSRAYRFGNDRMSWTYKQSTGELLLQSVVIGQGYSGFGSCRNNPTYQILGYWGPIPQGEYEIGAAFDSSHLGPVAMPLVPHPANHMFGRAGFFIHGDSLQHPGSASHGCIVIDRKVRGILASSIDHALQVIA